MRKSVLHDLLAGRGARFAQRAGAQVADGFTSFEREYGAVRSGVGITDFSFTQRFRIPEEGLDVLERYAAGSVANIRFGRVLHTFAADEEGMLESDLYIANDDENFYLIGESLVDDDKTRSVLDECGAQEHGVEDLSQSTALIGLDGYEAWHVAKELFGADVLGLPYLSIETYDLDGIEIKLIRAGKTSEFGYLLMVPAQSAQTVWERLVGAEKEVAPVGLAAHMGLRLDGRFFNIHAEGAAVRDPLSLGLQWMIDLDADDYRGKEAIEARRAAGLKRKIIGVVPEAGTELRQRAAITHQGEKVAEVITWTPSPTLGHPIGLALFDVPFAYSGLAFELEGAGRVKTVSLPPFTARSLTVKLDEM